MRNIQSLFLMLAAVAVVMTFSSQSVAQAQGYAGVFGGLSVPNADDTTSRPLFGALAGARLNGELGFGGFFFSSSKEETIQSISQDFNYDVYGLEGSFHFEGVADGAFIAGRVGTAKVKKGTVNFSPTAMGVAFGYDHFLSEAFSMGIEAGYMAFGSDDNNGASLDAFNVLNFAVAGKLWF